LSVASRFRAPLQGRVPGYPWHGRYNGCILHYETNDRQRLDNAVLMDQG
jgi:hypothetical protein